MLLQPFGYSAIPFIRETLLVSVMHFSEVSTRGKAKRELHRDIKLHRGINFTASTVPVGNETQELDKSHI